MTLLKKILAVLLCALVLAVAAVLLAVGPWPVYRYSGYAKAPYFREALAAIDTAAGRARIGGEVQPLRAGWAEREITPPVGHPMAGYGTRPNDKRSTGVREPLFVRALALNDGTDTVVLVGSDMLQTLPNLLEAVEARILGEAGMSNGQIMYTSSHTHSGPGGLAPGFAAKMSYGEYDPAYFALLVDRFAEAIVEAAAALAPARLAHGAVDVPDFIRNRTRRHGMVDSVLHFAAVERIGGGERLWLARYSAHCTAYGEEMLELNNDYAGAFQRAVLDRTGAPMLFMAGAVGSMRPNPLDPPLPDPWLPGQESGFENDIESDMVKTGKKTLEQLLADQRARVESMGAALADRMLAAAEGMRFEDRLDIASLEAQYSPPPAQARIVSPKWRLSPLAFDLLGVPKRGRIQAARLGSMFLAGMPHDFSGETSRLWQEWAAERGASLWVTSFSGAYLGYLSPDKHYHEIGPGLHYNQNYEIGQMNWFGPDQEAFMTDLFRHAFTRLTRNPAETVL